MANKGINGVRYFKPVENYYDDDYAKQCGLTGSEIDGNFYFLRGNDIARGSFDDETGIITLERVNGEGGAIVIEGIADYVADKVTEKEPHDFNGTYYDPIEDKLHLFFDGEEAFVVDHLKADMVVNVGEGMFGDGTVAYPLRVTPMYKTGYFAPVENVVDMSAGETRPVGISAGYRCLTKEVHSDSGLIYDKRGLEDIVAKLGSPEYNPDGWRVATRKDWDGLLNYNECVGYKNHDEYTTGPKGRDAGFNLKHPEYWENDDDNVTGNGFNVVPTHIDSNLGLHTMFWTDTDSCETNELYGKRFEHGVGTVCAVSLDMHDYAAIRLVNDNEHGRITNSEEILGKVYDVAQFKGEDGNVEYLQMWTTVNLNYENDDPSMYSTPDVTFEDSSSIRYYVNEWDGYSWRKTELKENYTVVINDYSGFSYYEWTVVKNEETNELELKSREEILRGHLSDDFSGLTDNIEQVLDNLNNAKEEIHEEIEQAKSDLNERITEEVANLNETIDESNAALTALVAAEETRAKGREDEIESTLTDAINAETVRAEEAESGLTNAIAAEAERAVNAESAITEELQNTNDSVSALTGDLAALSGTVADLAATSASGSSQAMQSVIANQDVELDLSEETPSVTLVRKNGEEAVTISIKKDYDFGESIFTV